MSDLVAEFNRRLLELNPRNPAFCGSPELFGEIWKAFPAAPVQLILRNFNKLGELRYVELAIPGIAQGGEDPSDCDHVYLARADFNQLAPEAVALFGGRDGALPSEANVGNFLICGPALARLLGRQVTLVHQQGTNEPDQADFDKYGPYEPPAAAA